MGKKKTFVNSFQRSTLLGRVKSTVQTVRIGMAFCAVGFLRLKVIWVWGQLVVIFIRSGRACEDYPRYLQQDEKDFREKSQVKSRVVYKGFKGEAGDETNTGEM